MTGVQQFLLQNKLAAFKKQSKETRNIFKKIFGCSLIVDLICTSIAVCYTCKPDNHSRESQSELPLPIPLNTVESDLGSTLITKGNNLRHSIDVLNT